MALVGNLEDYKCWKVVATEFKSNHSDALRPGLKIQSTKMSWCIEFSGIIVRLPNQEAIG